MYVARCTLLTSRLLLSVMMRLLLVLLLLLLLRRWRWRRGQERVPKNFDPDLKLLTTVLCGSEVIYYVGDVEGFNFNKRMTTT